MEPVSKIKSIMFSEFHPEAGPKIAYQVPEDFISKEDFDLIHAYIITKQDLMNRLITVNCLHFKVVGCPVFLDSPKYKRNALIFNLCFVFDKDAHTSSYEPVVKKLATYLTQLELVSSYLSEEDKKEKIPEYLLQILSDLNGKGCCSIQMGEATTIHLKVSPCIIDPPQVNDQDVPILLNSATDLNVNCWDLTTQQILPYVDGFNHVARIASEADVEINLVKSCIQNLLHYNVLKVISVFQYSNVFTTTPYIKRLVEDPDLKQKCLEFVRRKGHSLPAFRDVFLFYCSLDAGTTVKDLCTRYTIQSSKIDERKLIQFGLLKGLIRRLHKYPIKLPKEISATKHTLYKWFSGCHNYDEICCKTVGTCHVICVVHFEKTHLIKAEWVAAFSHERINMPNTARMNKMRTLRRKLRMMHVLLSAGNEKSAVETRPSPSYK